jgi:hypothetical protein
MYTDCVVDRAQLTAKLDRLAALRGDPSRGLPKAAWAENLAGIDHALLMRAAIDAILTLALPEWIAARPGDRRPQNALDAAQAWLRAPSDTTLQAAKIAAKECTAARNDTFGDLHCVPQAARGVAWAVSAPDGDHLYEAIASVEEGALARIALTAEYHRIPEARRALVDVLRRMLLPPEPAAQPSGPIPYALTAKFAVGDRVLHAKFGEGGVVAMGDTWIDLELADGTKKRLARRK